jgi:hypothetical protein
MLAFARQQIQERGLPQIEKEAAQWAKQNNLIDENFVKMPVEWQKQKTAELVAAYLRSLM